MAHARREVRFLVLGASLGRRSLNNRLAELAARVVEQKGGIAERATIADFATIILLSLLFSRDSRRPTLTATHDSKAELMNTPTIRTAAVNSQRYESAPT